MVTRHLVEMPSADLQDFAADHGHDIEIDPETGDCWVTAHGVVFVARAAR